MFRRRRALPTAERIVEIIAAEVALATRLPGAEHDELVDLTTRLLETKRWEVLDGVDDPETARVTIAANAAMPILAIGTDAYRIVASVIVQPRAHAAAGTQAGRAAGTVAAWRAPVAGQATPNRGPVTISWSQARRESRHPQWGRNLVIHEFAHKIDMLDGSTDGSPPLPTAEAERWHALLVDELERVEPRDGDEVLRSYAWSNPAEFFAVATETFFCRPIELAAAKPDLYTALRDIFRQDPATRADEP